MKRFWQKIPVWLKAVLISAVLLFPMVIIYQIVIQLNVEYYPQLPWGAVVVFILFWLYWRFTTGSKKLHALTLKDEAYVLKKCPDFKHPFWLVLAIVFLTVFIAAVTLSGFAFIADLTEQVDFTKYISKTPIQTAIPLLLATAVGAGVIEEIVFRGYMQKMTEQKYGVIFSFIFTGVLFTVLHFLPLPLVLPYILGSIAFSYITYRSNSIIPAIIAHALFDLVAFLSVYFNAKLNSHEYIQDALTQHIIIAIGSGLILVWILNKKMKSKNIA